MVGNYQPIYSSTLELLEFSLQSVRSSVMDSMKLVKSGVFFFLNNSNMYGISSENVKSGSECLWQVNLVKLYCNVILNIERLISVILESLK